MFPRIMQASVGAAALMVALFVLFGYAAGQERWYGWFTGTVPMSPVTALVTILLAVGVILGALNGLRRIK